MVPNVATFDKDGDGMLEIFETMSMAYVVPNVETFDKVGHGMQVIFETMSMADVYPSVVTLNKVGRKSSGRRRWLTWFRTWGRSTKSAIAL